MANLQTGSSRLSAGRMIRLIAAALAICCCSAAAMYAARVGLAKIDSREALTSGSLEAADDAVTLSPSDADAHVARAIALSFEERTDEAVREYEQAVRLRPRDYFLWLTLGTARDQSEDEKGALAAFAEAVRLAPSYAQPRWQLGNALLRAGRLDEAFVELRRAANSDSSLLPGLIDLAWGIYGGDAVKVEQIIQPQTAEWRLQLARFLFKHGKKSEALSEYRAAGDISDKERESLLQELLSARRFAEAYEIWSDMRQRQGAAKISSDSPGIADGSFEELKSLDQPGFGWQRARDVQTISISLDTNEPHSGKYSLRLTYQGSSDPNAQALSQLVPVEPESRYRLSFTARTQDVITGGLPVVIVTGAASDREQKLAQSNPLPKNTNGWQDYVIEFVTGKETSAVRISIQRQACAEQSCPIFGNVWLDDFILQKT